MAMSLAELQILLQQLGVLNLGEPLFQLGIVFRGLDFLLPVDEVRQHFLAFFQCSQSIVLPRRIQFLVFRTRFLDESLLLLEQVGAVVARAFQTALRFSNDLLVLFGLAAQRLQPFEEVGLHLQTVGDIVLPAAFADGEQRIKFLGNVDLDEEGLVIDEGDRHLRLGIVHAFGDADESDVGEHASLPSLTVSKDAVADR